MSRSADKWGRDDAPEADSSSPPDLGLFRALMDAADDAIYIADAEQACFIDVNDAACRLLGYSRDELLGRQPGDLKAPALRSPREQFREQIDHLREAGSFAVTTLHARKDGTTFPVEIRVWLLRHQGREYVLGITRELAEDNPAAAHLGLNEQLAALGNMARGIAHEFNNPLSYTIGNLELLKDELEIEDDGLRAILEDALHGANRLDRIVRDLTSIVQATPDTAEPVDVCDALEAAIRATAKRVVPHASIERRFEEVPKVWADASRLAQVFSNVLLNAADAIAESSTSDGRIVITVHSSVTGRVEVRFEDNGPGIPPAAIDKVFQPFFTTKPAGVGMGLGLSICHRILTRLGGRIAADNAPNGGAVFVVELAVATVQPDSSRFTAPIGASGAQGRVLIIDDDVHVGRVVARQLREYDVTLLGSARDAVQVLQEEPFDVIVCDLMMPGMTGMELHERLKERQPEVAERMLFITGGAHTAESTAFTEAHSDRCFRKPIRMKRLRELVAARLGSSSDQLPGS